MKTHLYWPFDEVELKTTGKDNEIQINSPWLSTAVSMPEKDYQIALSLGEKIDNQTLCGDDIKDVNYFFSALSAFPLTYILPRAQWEDQLEVFAADKSLEQDCDPVKFLKTALDSSIHQDIDLYLKNLKGPEWEWDIAGACDFSQTEKGLDPFSVFTVGRRFHLLSTVDVQYTNENYDYVNSLDKESEEYKNACLLMTRQNHYVTQKCNDALAPALETSGKAKKHVQHFIEDEFGHDRILDQALKSMGAAAEDVPVMKASMILMEILKASAQKNLLAFAMVVDFFERSSYQDSDPLAQVLEGGGFSKAASQIDKHKDINDEGEHENVALEFLEFMGPVSAEYASQALKIAEVATHFMNAIANEVLFHLKSRNN